MKHILFAVAVLSLSLSCAAQSMPAPAIIDYQQQSLATGGVFTLSENVPAVGNFLYLYVTCDYGNSGYSPDKYPCLQGATLNVAPGTGHYKYALLRHTTNDAKNWGMDIWYVQASVQGDLVIYAGTKFSDPGCSFKLSSVQVRGVAE
jgi:hypothetical protein